MPVPPIDTAALLVRGLNAEQLELERRAALDPSHLHNFERSIYSQFGEDGIIDEMLRRIGATSRTMIEIGAADGQENCTRSLVEAGWSGVWIEGSAARAALARSIVGERPVRVVEGFVTKDNIVDLLDSAEASSEPDLLVIDVDGNDAHVWQALGGRVRAKVVVIEYNATVGPVVDWVMPYDAAHQWAEDAYHGASLAALDRIGRSLGYRLVGCSSEGVNAFFVNASDAHHFTDRPLWEHYVGPRYRMPFGHPPVAFDAEPALVVPEAESHLLHVDAVLPSVHSSLPGSLVYFHVAVRNDTSVPVGTLRDRPVNLAVWWADSEGSRIGGEPARVLHTWRAEPGETASLVAVASVSHDPDASSLWVGLVQESVRWFAAPGRCLVADATAFSR